MKEEQSTNEEFLDGELSKEELNIIAVGLVEENLKSSMGSFGSFDSVGAFNIVAVGANGAFSLHP